MSSRVLDAHGPYALCHTCNLVVGMPTVEDPHLEIGCPRCGASVHRRKPDSLGRTLALLIAAAILMLQVFIANHSDYFETTVERADIRLLFLCIILGITSWTGLCRLLRGESLKLREAEYIQAAVSFGVAHRKIISRHILPNVMHVVLITVVLDFSGLVLAEAVLSYVGVGVDPTMNSWGNMINGARLEMAREPVVWWSLLAAFLFMFILVLAANLFSDAVRDAFDPRTRDR